MTGIDLLFQDADRLVEFGVFDEAKHPRARGGKWTFTPAHFDRLADHFHRGGYHKLGDSLRVPAVRGAIKQGFEHVEHAGRFVKLLYRDPRTPKWAKYGGALAVAPIPGPFEEMVGAAIMAGLWMKHRPLVKELWAKAAEEPEALASVRPAGAARPALPLGAYPPLGMRRGLHESWADLTEDSEPSLNPGAVRAAAEYARSPGWV